MGLFFIWFHSYSLTKDERILRSTPNCEGDVPCCIQTCLLPFLSLPQFPLLPFLSCPSLSVPWDCLLRLLPEHILILPAWFSARLPSYLPGSLSSLSQCSFLSLLLPGVFPCPICLLAFLFAQRPSMPRQLPFFLLRLIIYSHLCVGTYLPYSFKFSHFLLVLPGPNMRVTGEPVKLQREIWATYIRAHPIPR